MRLQLRSSLVKPAKKVIGKQRLTVLVNVSFPAPVCKIAPQKLCGAFVLRPVGRVVMQRIANPCTPVRFRHRPPY